MYLNANMHYDKGDYFVAERAFSDLRKNDNYRERAGFYRAMALLNMGRTDEGKEMLQAIVDDPEHALASEAAELLAAI